MSSIRKYRPLLQSHFNNHSTSLRFLLNLTLRPILFQFPQYRQSLLLYLFSRIFVKNPNHWHFMVTLWLLILIIGRNCDRNSVFAVFFLERVIETGFFIVNFWQNWCHETHSWPFLFHTSWWPVSHVRLQSFPWRFSLVELNRLWLDLITPHRWQKCYRISPSQSCFLPGKDEFPLLQLLLLHFPYLIRLRYTSLQRNPMHIYRLEF